MKRLMALGIIVTALTVLPATVARADSNPNGTGQPTQSCQQQSMTPGNAAAAPGSAFNPTGTAGSNYAGTQPQNSNNPQSVSQYDVACYQVSH